jgi:hypothetical protein
MTGHDENDIELGHIRPPAAAHTATASVRPNVSTVDTLPLYTESAGVDNISTQADNATAPSYIEATSADNNQGASGNHVAAPANNAAGNGPVRVYHNRVRRTRRVRAVNSGPGSVQHADDGRRVCCWMFGILAVVIILPLVGYTASLIVYAIKHNSP